jgi:hypothetical protein
MTDNPKQILEFLLFKKVANFSKVTLIYDGRQVHTHVITIDGLGDEGMPSNP